MKIGTTNRLSCKSGLFASAVMGCIALSASAASHAAGDDVDGAWTFGGAIRARYDYRPYADPSVSRISLDVIRVKANYESSSWFAAGQYRFYGGAYPYDYTNDVGRINFPEFAYAGFKFSPEHRIIAGLNQVPFGLLPYASNTFYETMANVVGLEDVHNLGVKYQYKSGPLDLQLGFYPRDGGNWTGTSSDSNRYSVNVVDADGYVTGGSNNEEQNLWVARAAYTFSHSERASSEVGLSAMHSTLRNRDTREDGDRDAYALHYLGQFDRFRVMAEVARQDMAPRNPGAVGMDTVTFGAFDGSFNVASKGTLYSVDLSYDVDWKWRFISDVKPYVNYSVYAKDKSGFKDSERLLAGVQFTAGPLYIYTEYRLGRNDPYTGDFTQGAGAGGENKWKRSLYMNFGYYF
ncbi:MAG: hypothetical protein HYS20_01975 [Rhodocyclales bacterium]|nr:hypothetical protein [Rhodocyclales bacterium]